MQATIRGIGSYVPETVIDNHQLAGSVLLNQFSVEQAYISYKTILEIAKQAAVQALENAQLLMPSEIDLIIVATITPDHIFPSVAA